MLGDLSGTQCAKLIGDICEAIECELDIFIVVSLEAVEEIAKNINSRVTLSGDSFVHLGQPIPDKLSISKALTLPYCPLLRWPHMIFFA